MKRALIVATVGGFLGQFEMNNVKLLQEKGYEVHYAANFDSNIYSIDFEKLEQRKVCIHQIAFVKNPMKLRAQIGAYKTLKQLIEELEIDLVHCHTPVGGFLGRIASNFAKRNVYTIYTAHGFHFYKGASWKNWIYYPIEYIAAKWTDCLVTINKEDLERAKSFGYKKNGYATQIPGVGLDNKRFSVQSDKNKEENKFCIVTIGEVNRNKNLEITIRALGRINQPDIEYKIYGRGRSVAYIENLIREYGLSGQIHYMGYCDKPENVLSQADLFLFPSIREGLGMAALEALACGVPVIALDNRGTREYMIDGKNGYVCLENTVEAFAENIEKAFLLYRQGKFREAFPKEVVSDVRRFYLSETEKVMEKIYERADKSIRNHGCT